MLRGRRDAAIREWTRSRELAAAMGLRHEHALGLAEAGGHLGDRALLAQAVDELTSLGALEDLRRAREALGRIPVAAA